MLQAPNPALASRQEGELCSSWKVDLFVLVGCGLSQRRILLILKNAVLVPCIESLEDVGCLGVKTSPSCPASAWTGALCPRTQHPTRKKKPASHILLEFSHQQVLCLVSLQTDWCSVW